MFVFAVLGSAWYAFGLDTSFVLRRFAFSGLSVIVVFSSTALAVRVAQTGDVIASESMARAALDQLHAQGEPHGRVLVRAADTPVFGIERAVVNELARAGHSVKVDPELGFVFGESRTAIPAQVDEVMYVAEGGQYLSVLSGEPNARVVWSTNALPPAEEQELRTLQRQLWNVLRTEGRPDLFTALSSPLAALVLKQAPAIDEDAVRRMAQLNHDAARNAPCRCGIVTFPAADAPAENLPQSRAPASVAFVGRHLGQPVHDAHQVGAHGDEFLDRFLGARVLVDQRVGIVVPGSAGHRRVQTVEIELATGLRARHAAAALHRQRRRPDLRLPPDGCGFGSVEIMSRSGWKC